MVLPRSIKSFARFVSLASCIAGAGVVLHDADRADACGGWEEPAIEDLVTFDASIADAPQNLELNTRLPGFPESCTDCEAKTLLADWRGYLKDTGVTDADWEQVLFKASGVELEALAKALAGKGKPPAGYEKSSLWKQPAARDKLRGAVALVVLARAVEPLATFSAFDASGQPTTTQPPPPPLLAEANAGMKTKDAFLAQRFAFQAIRIRFYRKDWAGVIALFEKTPALATPSAHLAWSARYYYAGALRRAGKLAKANLELAHISASYPLLAESATQDFHPKEDGDWHESLKLASDARGKTELWRAVGLKLDGLVAIQEIIKLDPKSNLLALLVVRELNRAESLGDSWSTQDAQDVPVRRKKLYAQLEQIAQKLAGTPGADRPWLMELVAGHIAAKRGDLGAARIHLGNALNARKGDPRVASQAKASLALALAQDWKINPQHEDELARSMREIDPKFGATYTVTRTVRNKLAQAYAAAGRVVDAEFLAPGAADPVDPQTGRRIGKGKPKWSDLAFIKDMLARLDRTTTEFDKFVVAGTFTRPQLSQELALRYLLDGDFATASKTFQSTKATSEQLHTDPFVNHIVDCHDCDHEKFANAAWTHASMTARLVELQKAANGTGEPAAEAALALGNALYNITWYGNARSVLEGSHQATRDTRAAERWFKRAFDLTAKRELKAKAAFYAAKCELGTQLNAQFDAVNDTNPSPLDDSLPVPKTWFPIVRRFADTKYYKEVLRECGHFQRWASTQH